MGYRSVLCVVVSLAAAVLWCGAMVQAGRVQGTTTGRNILVFGGNGFLGASTVERLLEQDDHVTIVNRGNWYWDSAQRIKPNVDVITCDRLVALETCLDLVTLVDAVDTFDAVIDFSAYGPDEVKGSASVLKGKVKLYVLISTDSVYEVCEKKHSGPTRETDAVRPEDPGDRYVLGQRHEYAEKKLQAEEQLVAQRQHGGEGFPFVILRLPDVIGSRDTTHRWWLYQLWVKLSQKLPSRPLRIPLFLEGYEMSLVYVEDVARGILDILAKGPEVHDQILNLAFPETFTMETMLKSIQKELDLDYEIGLEDNRSHDVYLYPSVRRGPVDVSRAQSLINWKTTPWADAVRESVRFYENAMRDDEAFPLQRDEIIQVVMHQLHPNSSQEFYEALEDTYNITLHHFKFPRDEL